MISANFSRNIGVKLATNKEAWYGLVMIRMDIGIATIKASRSFMLSSITTFLLVLASSSSESRTLRVTSYVYFIRTPAYMGKLVSTRLV